MAILDADKEGFLRSARSLIQTIGRAARNVNGHVIMYGDRITAAMELALEETRRRRELQGEYNRRHGITPATVKKSIMELSPASGTSGDLPPIVPQKREELERAGLPTDPDAKRVLVESLRARNARRR